MDGRDLPIGIFDSGLGGLTALAELNRLMPDEKIIYFGDNARIPYGTKSVEVIKKFALQDTRFLLSRGVKAILVACGTVSSNCLPEVRAEAGIPVIGVIEPASVKAAAIAGKDGCVAVLGTGATVKSGAYERELESLGVRKIVSKACPMFVPLVENGYVSTDDTAANSIAAEYLAPVAEHAPKAAILGCTHYPLLDGVIKKYLPGTETVNSGSEAAKSVCEELKRLDLTSGSKNGGITFYTSDDAELFRKNAAFFLGREVTEEVIHAEIENF